MINSLFALLRIVLGVVIGLPLLLMPLLYFLQESMIFPGFSVDEKRERKLKELVDLSEFSVENPEGIELTGWFLDRSARHAGPSPLVIYFGGNAEDVSYMAGDSALFGNRSVLLVNYRGYGRSGGKPGEPALKQDALFLYDQMVERSDIDKKNIAVVGRSLGSGVGVYLASQRLVNRLVLVTPFDSLRAVAQGIYPFIPVGWILRHPFDSASLAPQLNIPVLAVVGGEDRLVPESHARALMDVWGGPVTYHRIAQADHNSIGWFGEYPRTVAAFLNGE